ncbi:hypothetical protein [Streptacidiphilus sp. PAMC 29251]
MTIGKKTVVLMASTVLATAGIMVTNVSSASATTYNPADYRAASELVSGNFYDIIVYTNVNETTVAGEVTFSKNPLDGYPGDAIRAYDALADGYGIEATLNVGERFATTSGHSSPYYSPWATGNLPEGTSYQLSVQVIKGGLTYFADTIPVVS